MVTQETVRVVTQNILHGTACAPDTDFCNVGARVDLFARQLQAAACPELVGLQEGNQRVVTELGHALPNVCNGKYEIVWDGAQASDREIVLTTNKVLGFERTNLVGPLRTAFWVRVQSDAGPVDLVTTHLASSSDDGPCNAVLCPPPCTPEDTLKLCGGREAAKFLAEKRDERGVAILAGDLNAEPDEPTIRTLVAEKNVDTYLQAGNNECDPGTGRGCTSGRVDDSLVDMTNAQSKQHVRIDYVLLANTPRCAAVQPTGVFAPEGGPSDGSAGALVFPSDHSGVLATLSCTTTDADRAAGEKVVEGPTATTAASAKAAEPEIAKAEITAAFKTVFAGGDTDPQTRIASIEDGERVRASFLRRLETVKELSAGITVRIDAMRPVSDNEVAVTYTILLNGQPVLDSLPGRAVRDASGAWLVARATYCEVARLGEPIVPEGCEDT